MKKVLFLLLISNACFAQSGLITTYHPIINKAELAICNNDLKLADILYKEAFTFMKNPLAKDLYNASACKLLLGDIDNAKSYFIKLAKKGIKWKDLDFLRLLKNYEKELKDFKPTYDIIEESAESNFSDSIHYKAQKLNERSILINKKNRENNTQKFLLENFKKENKTQFKIEIKDNQEIKPKFVQEILKKEWADHETYKDSLAKVFNEYIKFHDFPSEDESLIYSFDYYPEDEIVSPITAGKLKLQKTRFINALEILKNDRYNSSIDSNGIESLVQRNGSFTAKITDEQLIKAIDNGKMSPDLAWYLSENNISGQDFGLKIVNLKIEKFEDCDSLSKLKYRDFILVSKRVSNQKIKEFNELASQFGVNDIDNMQRKVAFNLIKNKYFILPTYGQYESETIESCETAEIIYKNFNILNYKFQD